MATTEVTLTDYAKKLQQLILKAPAGGIFHDAIVGPIRTLSEQEVQIKATFPFFVDDLDVYDVTITKHTAV